MNARFNMIIPDELLERVKVVATKQRKSVSEIIREFLDCYANEQPEETRLESIERRITEIERKINK